MSNASYCPTMIDIASGVGCSLKNTRACDNQLIAGELLLPYTASTSTAVNETNNAAHILKIYKIAGISSGKITSKTAIATFNGVTTASTSTTTGALTVAGGIGASGNIYASNVYGAVWNDYAEYRQSDCLEAGRVICENGDDTLSLATERLQPGAEIISDTFGFAIGKTDKAQTPIAVSGRVLAYTYEDRNQFKPGDAVCAAPGGTISKMTREEIKEYPERIIGTVSAIPSYETWGEGNVPVNGRIWIKIR